MKSLVALPVLAVVLVAVLLFFVLRDGDDSHTPFSAPGPGAATKTNSPVPSRAAGAPKTSGNNPLAGARPPPRQLRGVDRQSVTRALAAALRAQARPQAYSPGGDDDEQPRDPARYQACRTAYHKARERKDRSRLLKDAERCFRAYTEDYPGDYRGHALLGACLVLLGKTNAAYIEYETALRLNPRSKIAPQLSAMLAAYDSVQMGIEDERPMDENESLKVVLQTAAWACSHQPGHLEMHLRLAEKILRSLEDPDPSYREEIDCLRQNCPHGP